MRVTLDEYGIGHARAALQRGEPIVLPPPSPITYGLAGTDPGRINTAKGRPAEQPVGFGLTRIESVAAYLPVGPTVLAVIERLLFHELLTVLTATSDDRPDWLQPATVDGQTLLAGAWLPETLPIVTGVDHLYLSSGNRTSRSPHATAAEADREFDGRLLVVDADDLRSLPGEHGATTTVRVHPNGALSVVRNGVQNRATETDPAAYLEHLQEQATGPGR